MCMWDGKPRAVDVFLPLRRLSAVIPRVLLKLVLLVIRCNHDIYTAVLDVKVTAIATDDLHMHV